MTQAPILIELDQIGKTYRQPGQDGVTVTALHGIDLRVRKGEFVALQGTSGSGKSTLMHVLGLLDSPTGGRYTLQGRDVGNLDDAARSELRNRLVGFVFQSFYLIPYISTLDNVLLPGLYGPESQRVLRERALSLLALVGLADRTGFRPTQLSGGQQQRVALARALINAPELLLADEPTGQLDSATGVEIMNLLRRINDQGTTVILVTHDDAIAAYARRRVRMEDGRIVDDGQEDQRP